MKELEDDLSKIFSYLFQGIFRSQQMRLYYSAQIYHIGCSSSELHRLSGALVYLKDALNYTIY